MKPFQKKTRDWMIGISLLLFASITFYLYQHARLNQLTQDWIALESKTSDLQKTQQEIARYNKVTQRLAKIHGHATLRQESVAVKATFSENELHQAPTLLKNSYEGGWVFQIERFTLKTVDPILASNKKEKEKHSTDQQTLEMTVTGNKTFLFFSP